MSPIRTIDNWKGILADRISNVGSKPTFKDYSPNLMKPGSAFYNILLEIRNLELAAPTLTPPEQKLGIEKIRALLRDRLREISVQKKDARADLTDNPPVSTDPQIVFHETKDKLSATGRVEKNLLIRMLSLIEGDDINVIKSLQQIQDVFFPNVIERQSAADVSMDTKGILADVTKLGAEAGVLSKDDQLRRLGELQLKLKRKIGDLDQQISQLENEQQLLFNTTGSRDPSIEADLQGIKKERALLHQLLNSLDTTDVTELRNLANNEAIAEYDALILTEKVSKQEKMRENPGLRLLEKEGFDPEILYLDTTEIKDPAERDKAINEKYSYLEMAVVSLIFRQINTLINPMTIMSPEIGSMDFEPPVIPGQPSHLNVESLISQIANSALEGEDDRAANSELYLGNWLDTYSNWINKYKEFAGVSDRKGLIDVIPDSNQSQFFNPNWLWKSGGRIPISQAPYLMVEVQVDGHREWRRIGRDTDNHLNLWGKALLQFFKNSRFSAGFFWNTVSLKLNDLFNRNGKQYDKAPHMWRTAGDEGKRLTKLFSPLIYISPSQGHVGATPPLPERTPMLPSSLVAKDDTNNQRTKNIRQVFLNNLPDGLELVGDKVMYREKTGQMLEVTSNTYMTMVYLTQMTLELSGFSAMGDNAVTVSENSSSGAISLDELNGDGTTVIPSIEGKHPSQRDNPTIAAKYAQDPLKQERDLGPYGQFNQASLALVGPKAYADYFDFVLLAGRDPSGKFRVASMRDWVVITEGDIGKIPTEQVPETSTEKWANLRNFSLRLLNFINEKGDPITQIQQLNPKEGFIEVVSDPLINALINLERWIGVYILQGCDGDNVTSRILNELLKGDPSTGDLDTEIQTVIDVLFPDAGERSAIDAARRNANSPDTDIKKALGRVRSGDRGHERRVEAIQSDLNSRTDYMCRILIKNTDTGEVTYWDTTAYQHFQAQPSVLLNQADDYQISDLKTKSNPNGKHFAKWYSPGKLAWDKALELISSSGSGFTDEEINLWRSYTLSPEDHPMPILIMNIGGRRSFNADNGEYDGPPTGRLDPKLMFMEKVFFDAVGAANSSGNIFERMTAAQKAALEVAFSDEARWKFAYHYYEGVGRVSWTKFVNAAARKLGPLLGISAQAVENFYKNEIPPGMILPSKGSRGRILRWIHGRMGARSTFDEIIKDPKEREKIAKIFNLDFK